MPTTISLTQTGIFTALIVALKTFGLTAEDGGAVQIIRGQVNRVPEPKGRDFVVLWPTTRTRLEMNTDISTDVQFIGSITGNTLTVAAPLIGASAVGQSLYAPGIAAGCFINADLGGNTFAVTTTPDVAQQVIYAGTTDHLQPTEVTIQADIHGPMSADNAARIATLWRDQFGIDACANVIAPLYTSEPRQIPFDNGEQQVEERWVVDLAMQANVTITTTQQFADDMLITATPVEVLA